MGGGGRGERGVSVWRQKKKGVGEGKQKVGAPNLSGASSSVGGSDRTRRRRPSTQKSWRLVRRCSTPHTTTQAKSAKHAISGRKRASGHTWIWLGEREQRATLEAIGSAVRDGGRRMADAQGVVSIGLGLTCSEDNRSPRRRVDEDSPLGFNGRVALPLLRSKEVAVAASLIFVSVAVDPPVLRL